MDIQIKSQSIDYSLPLDEFLHSRFTQWRFTESIASLPKNIENRFIFFIKRIFNKKYETPQTDWSIRQMFDLEMLKQTCEVHADENNNKIEDIISFKDGNRFGVFINYGAGYEKFDFDFNGL